MKDTMKEEIAKQQKIVRSLRWAILGAGFLNLAITFFPGTHFNWLNYIVFGYCIGSYINLRFAEKRIKWRDEFIDMYREENMRLHERNHALLRKNLELTVGFKKRDIDHINEKK